MASRLLLVALACGMLLLAPAAGAAPSLDAEDIDVEKPKWCKACMDLECYVYVPYPCWREFE